MTIQTLQGALQQSIRNALGCANDFNGDLHAMCDLYGIPAAPISGRLIPAAQKFDASITTASSALNYFLQNPQNACGTLALDFTTTSTLDPRITFSRGSQATLFDSTGTLVYAKHNLLLQSEDFSTTWAATGATVSTNATTAPSGASTADKLVADSAITVSPSSVSAFVRQDITKAATATTYTFSLFAKAGEFNAVRLFARDNATSANNAAVTVLLTNGTVLTAAAAGGTFTNASVAITNAGNGWYRVALTFTSSTETTIRFIYAVGDSSTTTGDASKGIFIWGAQLNLANMEGGVTSSLTTYYPTTTAAYYAPRFDYNPSTLQPLGLLIEEARTNLWLYSEDITNAAGWSSVNATRTAATEISPAGTLTAGTWTVTANGASTLVSNGGTITAGATVAHSVYVKKSANTDWVFLGLRAPDFNHEAGVFININTGAIGNSVVLAGTQVSYVANSATATSVGNGWYRISASFATTVATSVVGSLRAARSNGSINNPVAGDSYFIWGRQGEAGAFPTSYIPTTTTALTRNADVASMTGTNFSSWYNASEGTLYADFQWTTTSSRNNSPLFRFDDGTNNNFLQLGFRNVSPSAPGSISLRSSGGTTYETTTGTVNTNDGLPHKFAGAYTASELAFSADGQAAGTATPAGVPTVTTARFGASNVGVPSNYAIYIRRIAYYPVRLASSQLQALTA